MSGIANELGLPVSTLQETDLDDDRRAAIADLIDRVFFPPGTRFERGPAVVDGVVLARPAECVEMPDGRVFSRPALRGEAPPRLNLRRFVIWQDGAGPRALAHALTFERVVYSERGALTVAALGAVCVDGALQGRGLGACVTAAAFAQVANNPAVVGALFQTGVPGFYEKLGCRVVANRFVDRLTAVDPDADAFWERCVMVYPADLAWPVGVIDLGGPGF